jgi:phosphoglycerate dehydrogenase-like enzyme
MNHDTIKIVIIGEVEGVADVLRGMPGVDVMTARNRETALHLAGKAEVLCLERYFDTELFQAAQNVRWIHVMMGGVETALFPELVNSPVPLTCIKQSFGIPGAHHAMATMLAIQTRLLDYWWLRSGRTLKWQLPSEIGGMTLGIIGFGNIGRTLAQLARAFEMRVLAVARRARSDPSPAHEVWGADQLPRLLGESDFVVMAAPVTEQTRGMFGERQLRMMKPTAWFIDISGRQAIVGYEAVISALKEKRIAGADLQFASGKSVQFASAPEPSSPLWSMENLIISQYSANSVQEERRSTELFIENVRRYQGNQPLLGLVDKKAGY